MDIKSDVSFMYWSPAPPKWDLPPAAVKQVLFPDYHGAGVAEERVASPGLVLNESEGSDDDEELLLEDTDPEDRMARDRYLCLITLHNSPCPELSIFSVASSTENFVELHNKLIKL